MRNGKKLSLTAFRKLLLKKAIFADKKSFKKKREKAKNQGQKQLGSDSAQRLLEILRERILTVLHLEGQTPVREAVSKIIDYADSKFTDWSNTKHSVLSQIQPEGTRFVKVGDECSIFVIEQKPSVRTLKFDDRLLSRFHVYSNEATAGGDHVFQQVSLPYVVFIMTMTNQGDGSYLHKCLKTFFRNKPLRSPDDELGHSILPNMRREYGVCLGPRAPTPTGTVNEVAEAILSHYWNSPFSMDYVQSWEKMAGCDERLKNLQGWADATKADPLFILGVDWEISCKLRETIGSVGEFNSKDTAFIQKTAASFEEEISKLVALASKVDLDSDTIAEVFAKLRR